MVNIHEVILAVVCVVVTRLRKSRMIMREREREREENMGVTKNSQCVCCF